MHNIIVIEYFWALLGEISVGRYKSRNGLTTGRFLIKWWYKYENTFHIWYFCQSRVSLVFGKDSWV